MTLARIAILLLILSVHATAAVASTDEQLSALLKKREYGQIDKLARERLRANAGDEQAYNFLAVAALSGDPSMREDAIPMIKTCTEKLPKSSRCHHRLGLTFGISITFVLYRN